MTYKLIYTIKKTNVKQKKATLKMQCSVDQRNILKNAMEWFV